MLFVDTDKYVTKSVFFKFESIVDLYIKRQVPEVFVEYNDVTYKIYRKSFTDSACDVGKRKQTNIQ